MKKRIASFLLMIALVVTMIPATTVKVSAAVSGESVKKAALSLVDTKYSPRGYCLKVVDKIYDKAGVSLPGSACCAFNYGNKYRESTSRNNIPLGAWVYFSKSGDYPCGNHYAGHIGVYVGDDRIVHTWGGGTYSNGNTFSYIKKTTINEVTSSGYKYCGWGIPSGVSRNWVTSLEVSNVTSSGKPYLTWDKRTNASKYYVYRATGKNGSFQYLNWTSGTTFTNTSAKAGTYYRYYIKAVDSNGKTLQSTYAKDRTCDLARPVITTSCRASDGKPIVTWDEVYNADRYYVYRATSKNGTYTKMLSTTGTSYVNTSATAGKYYYYKVRAIYDDNSSANSAYSAVDYRMCDLARPVVSVSGRASDGKPVITWNKVSDASHYEVYRATSKNGSYSRLGTSNTLKFTNTSAVEGNTYYYKVKAIYSANSAANSAYSLPVSMSVKDAIGLVSESDYNAYYSDSSKYTATPYYRYKTRTRSTTTSTSYPLSGWTLYDEKNTTTYGTWTAAKPSGNYQSTSAYYYYAYTCDCHQWYWKSSSSTKVCEYCGTKQKNLLRVYSSNNPANQFTKDTDGSYFTPKKISKSSPGKFGTIYRISYNGSGISSFSSNKSTSFLWPSSALKETLYRPVTTKYTYYYEKYGSWSDWSDWTSTYKVNSDTNQRDTEVKYYITNK